MLVRTDGSKNIGEQQLAVQAELHEFTQEATQAAHWRSRQFRAAWTG